MLLSNNLNMSQWYLPTMKFQKTGQDTRKGSGIKRKILGRGEPYEYKGTDQNYMGKQNPT